MSDAALQPASTVERSGRRGLSAIAGRLNARRARSAGKTRRGDGSYQPLVVVLFAAAAGVVIDRYSPLPAFVWLGACAAAWFVWWRRCQRGGQTAAIALLISVVGLFAAWHHASWYLYPADALATYAREAAEPVCVEAIATETARRIPAPPETPLRAISSGPRTRVTMDVVRIRDGQAWRSVTGLALVTIDGSIETPLAGVRAGDRLRVVGQLSGNAPPRNPGEFDFARDARAIRRQARLWCDHPECVRIVAGGSLLDYRRLVGRLREYGDRAFARYVGHERSGLAAALVVGLREQLDAERGEAFLESGMMHVLSISGLHVGLLAVVLFGVLRMGLVPRGPALLAIVALVGLYAILTDAGAPVVRATVMVALVCASIHWGRPALRFNSLAAAALVVLVMNPADLFRVGPQLSFLAVAVMAWMFSRLSEHRPEEDPLDRLLRLSRPWPAQIAHRGRTWLWRALLVSSVIWLVTSPLVLARFNVLSPGAMVLNLLFTVPVALALLSGFGVMLFGWVAPPLAALLGAVCDWNLQAMDGLVAAANRLPGTHLWLPGPATWWLLGLYGGLALALLLPKVLRPAPRWCLALAAFWVTVGIAASWWSRQPEQFRCTFVSVGHGSATVLELPGGQTLLYDAGQLGSPTSGARAIAGALWSRGITHLDGVVLSHADVDHFNALPELIERFSVGAVYVSTVMLDSESPAIKLLVTALRREGIPLRKVSAGDRLRNSGGAILEFRHPTREGVLGSDNANSLVLSVGCAGRRILLTGDLEGRGLDQVLAEEPLDCDVVAAPHHGSARSNPPGFAAWSTPEWVVISGGLGAESREVEKAYRAAGAHVLHTARDGAVSVVIDRRGLAVRPYRQ